MTIIKLETLSDFDLGRMVEWTDPDRLITRRGRLLRVLTIYLMVAEDGSGAPVAVEPQAAEFIEEPRQRGRKG